MARGDGAGLQRTVAPAAGAGAASLRSAPHPPLRRFQTRPRKDSDKDSDGVRRLGPETSRCAASAVCGAAGADTPPPLPPRPAAPLACECPCLTVSAPPLPAATVNLRTQQESIAEPESIAVSDPRDPRARKPRSTCSSDESSLPSSRLLCLALSGARLCRKAAPRHA